MRGIIVRLLGWSVIAALVLPIMVAVIVGLAALLAALGDTVAAVICQRVALVVGVLWLLAIIVTSVCSGVIAIEGAAAADDRSLDGHRGESPR